VTFLTAVLRDGKSGITRADEATTTHEALPHAGSATLISTTSTEASCSTAGAATGRAITRDVSNATACLAKTSAKHDYSKSFQLT